MKPSEAAASFWKIAGYCTEYLQRHKPEEKFAAVKDEFNCFLQFCKAIKDSQGHEPECNCPVVILLEKRQKDSPAILRLVVDDEKNIIGGIGIRVGDTFVPAINLLPKVVSLEDLETLEVTPFECIAFVKEDVERRATRMSATQEPASA